MTQSGTTRGEEAADKQLEDSARRWRSRKPRLREETRKATNKRRYQVGAMADDAGLLAWSNAELAAAVCCPRASTGQCDTWCRL